MIGNRNCEGTEERGKARNDGGREEVLTALSKPIRRRALRYLDEAAGAVSLSELAAHLADGDDRPNRERTATSLHHVHLPKLADCGLVEYDPENHRVEGTVPARVEPYLELAD